jgi:hypothetical protein
LHLAKRRISPATINQAGTTLRFFFKLRYWRRVIARICFARA